MGFTATWRRCALAKSARATPRNAFALWHQRCSNKHLHSKAVCDAGAEGSPFSHHAYTMQIECGHTWLSRTGGAEGSPLRMALAVYPIYTPVRCAGNSILLPAWKISKHYIRNRKRAEGSPRRDLTENLSRNATACVCTVASTLP